MDVGGGWTETGTWDIQSNKGRTYGTMPSGTGFLAIADAGTANVTLQVTITPAGSGAEGLALRYSDGNNFWFIDGYVGGDTLRLYQRAASSWYLRDSAAAALSAGVPFDISATADGNNFSGSIGGASVSYASAWQNDKTNHGLSGNDAGTTFDDFKATAP